MDALLRLLPTVRDVDAVRPKLVLEQTRGLYPEIGDDLTRLVDVAREAPDTAESAMRSLLLMALAGRRPFWSEERRFLAERVLELVPELLWPVHVLAEADIVSGDVGAAIERLLEPVSRPAPDLTSLRLFSEAANALGEPTWAVAVLTKVAAEDLEAQLLLADALRVQGEHEKALALYKEYLLTHNGDLDALLGALQSIAARREEEGLVLLAQQALEWHPGDDELLRTIGSALFNLRDPGADAVALMESIFSEYEHSYLVGEALARTQLDDVERLEPTLELLYERMRDLPLYDPEVPESRLHAVILTRSARLARTAGLLELAREMNDVALLAGAVGMGQYRELAYIELEQGRIETARRYFDVIVFIDPSDRQSAMTLAQLDFEHFGNPTRAAEVIRRTYPTQAPPSAVTILAAELFLLGRVEDALNTFHRVRESPGVLDQTFRTVGLIAYASGLDELAVPLFMQFHRDAAEDAPGRARIEWLLEERLDAGPKRGKGNTAASG